MYTFEDKDGSNVCLRPEMTAGVARSYLQNGLVSESQPVKMWYLDAMFRHDRPQAGRYRQFHQFGLETIGSEDPVMDAEIISAAYNFYRDLGIQTMVHINSIGTLEDRERYLIELTGYLRSKKSFLSEASQERLKKNPLRILDSKEEQDQPIIEEAPQILDWLSEESKKHFMTVLEYLDELSIPYMLQPSLVRGLDYYSDTVFEFYEEGGEHATQGALGGGGRYNGLLEELGGEPTPACGFAAGVERVVLALKEQEQADGGRKDAEPRSSIFFAHLGAQAKRRALALIETLRREGIIVIHSLGKKALKAQLEIANKNNVTHTVILGQKELQDDTVIIRDMESGIQETVDQKKLGKELQ
jgi:histidyl-tRNA synthetase